MLCDTGPQVALGDARDPYHALARQTFAAMPVMRLTTTLACLTEAMYLLGKLAGNTGQERLWRLLETGRLEVDSIDSPTLARMRILMTKYRDAPMDFADSSLVALAESKGDHKVFTFDQHFRTYLIHDRIPFEVIP